MNALPSPIILQASDFDDPRKVLRWTREDRNNIDDPGEWDGDPQWVALADTFLAGRIPVVVLRPNITYTPNPNSAGTSVEAVAAAMIGAADGRADVTALLDELPPELLRVDPGDGQRIF